MAQLLPRQKGSLGAGQEDSPLGTATPSFLRGFPFLPFSCVAAGHQLGIGAGADVLAKDSALTSEQLPRFEPNQIDKFNTLKKGRCRYSGQCAAQAGRRGGQVPVDRDCRLAAFPGGFAQ